MSNKILDNETINSYQKIIAHEVWSYIRKTDNPNLEADNLIQDLWVEILEYNNVHGQLPDYALTKKICQNTLVDITRKGIHRNHISMDLDTEGDRASWEADTSTMDNAISSAETDELLNMFPEGSNERKYIEFYLSKAGIKDIVRPEDKGREGGYTDSALAKSLGYHGTGDRAWKKFSAQMKSIIADYYGYKQ